MPVTELKSAVSGVESINCFHCLNPVPPNLFITGIANNQEVQYCCNGCKLVSELIRETGSNYFYELRGTSELEPVDKTGEIQTEYDSPDTYLDYVIENKAGHSEVNFTVLNIHCSACVWLIEKILKEQKGVINARINFATGIAHIEYNKDLVRLSEIVHSVGTIGYKLKLYSSENAEKSDRSSRDLFYRMVVAGFCFGNIMLFSSSLYAGFFSGIELSYKKLLHYVSWALATPAYFYSGFPFLRGALSGLKNKALTMDVLLVLGISIAYFYSIYVTLSDIGEVYFDSVCTIYFFVLIGKYFESAVRSSAQKRVGSLLGNLPEESILISESGEIPISSRKIEKGDRIKIKPGNRVPVDGLLESEFATLDESFLTGESVPVNYSKGAKIFAGSVCIVNPITLCAIASSKNSTLSRLKQVIDDSVSIKPNAERVTDRIAAYFIGTVLFFAVSTFIYWSVNGSTDKAVLNVIAVLIVACPCALGLAVPTALVINTILCSREGILIKNPDLIEPMSKPDTIIFDKTGTLTSGILSVNFESPGINLRTKLFAYLTAKDSTHPAARSLYSELLANYPEFRECDPEIIQSEEIPGQGIFSRIEYAGESFEVKLGRNSFANPDMAEPDQGEGSRIYISVNDIFSGYWSLRDTLRPGTAGIIKQLSSLVPNVILLSGDREEPVRSIAGSLGIRDFFFNKTPEEKLNLVTDLQGKRRNIIMIGDGFNDSACLAASNVGITLGIASDTSIDKSDIILVRNNLSGIVTAIKNSKSTAKVIRQNILISFLYNSIMLPLAAAGFMIPVICAGLMTLSSISVLLNSFSLYLRKNK